jgi:hypothetical protein
MTRRASDAALADAVEAIRELRPADRDRALCVVGHYLHTRAAVARGDDGERWFLEKLLEVYPWLPDLVATFERSGRLRELARECRLALVRAKRAMAPDPKQMGRLGPYFVITSTIAALREFDRRPRPRAPMRPVGTPRATRARRAGTTARVRASGSRSGDDDPEPDDVVLVREGAA